MAFRMAQLTGDHPPEAEAVRAQVLDAAGRVFVRDGYYAASVREIASEAGFTTGAIYSNFRGKPDLLLALFERHNQRLGTEIAAAARSEREPERQIARSAERWMRFLREEPAWYGLLIEFWILAVRDPRLRLQYAERFRVIRTSIGSLIEARAGELGLDFALSGDELGSVAIALADGLALQRLADPDAVPDELFGSVLTSLVQSLARSH
jgi:AcrR family transcriptional regulator